MQTLIIKLGAAGDVVRTTSLLRVVSGDIHWLTSDLNSVILEGVAGIARLFTWEERESVRLHTYDLVINLEDSTEVGALLKTVRYKELFGAYLDDEGRLIYTENSKEWFDLSLISSFGKEKADELKFQNRKTYQEMIFRGLGYEFKDEQYCLPSVARGQLTGDIAISNSCGTVWPMKNWAYYDDLKKQLEETGVFVNYLPKRDSVLDHIGDIQNHKYLISGDTLPMHIALGSGMKCVTIFTCTSPWEIHGYGLQKKLVSPCLGDFFYKRHFESRATTCISLSEVYAESVEQFGL